MDLDYSCKNKLLLQRKIAGLLMICLNHQKQQTAIAVDASEAAIELFLPQSTSAIPSNKFF